MQTRSKVHFKDKQQALQFKPKINKTNWHSIEEQPWLKTIYEEPPIISCRQGITLKSYIIAKLYEKSKKRHVGGMTKGLSTPLKHLFFNRRHLLKIIVSFVKFNQNIIEGLRAKKGVYRILADFHFL